jgi:hypothetical protein
MATLTLSHRGIFDRLALPSWRRNLTRKRGPAPNASPEDARLRRQFLHEMLTRNSAAFSSELDVQGMMYLHAGRF